MKHLLALLFLPAFAAAQGRHLRLADSFFDAKAFSLAAEEYRAFIRSGELLGEARARVRLGQSYQRLGDFPRSTAAYQEFLDAHPSHPLAPEAWLGLGLSLQARGRYEDSQKALKGMLEGYPRHPKAGEAAFSRAENQYYLGRYQEAEESYRRLKDQYPDFSRPEYIPYARAWCFFRLSETPSRGDSASFKKEGLQKAVQLFGEVVSVWPGSELAPHALYQQGEASFAAADYKAAGDAYQKLETRYAEHLLVPAARYSTAWCKFQAGQWKDASTAFHKFAVVHEDHELAPWAMYLAGVSLARAKDYDLAQSAYELTLKKYPSSDVVDKAHYGLAWLATVRQDYVAAIQAYEQFVEKFPQSSLAPSALFLRADALYHQERYSSAREDYLRLLKRYPDSKLAEDALFFAAGCSLAAGEYPRARDEYQQFRRLRSQSPYYAEAALREADAAYGMGAVEDAEKAYREILKSGKGAQAAGARSGLAWISFQNKRWQEAYDQWKRVAADHPEHPLAGEALLHAGDSLYNMSRYEEARALYRQCSQKTAGKAMEAEAQYQSGWASYRLKDFDQAYVEWGNSARLSKAQERVTEARYWMAWALFRKGQFPEAAQAFHGVRERYPKSHLAGEAGLREADSLYNAKDYEAAIRLYEEVVAKNPGDTKAAAALHGIQWCYYALGRDEEAVAASKAFLEKNKGAEFAPEVQYRVAEHYLNRSNFQQAEKELDALKASYPESRVDLNATYWRGQARFKNLKFNEAIQDWKQVVAKAPANPLAPRAQFKVGLAYYRLQEYPEALAAFGLTLDAYGNTPDVAADALFNRGMTFKRMRRDEEAVGAYEQVIKGYPSSPLANMARIRVGYIHEDAGNYDKAISAYSALSASDPGRLGAEAQYLVGDCYLAQKKPGEALLAYQEVVERFKEQSSWVVTALAKIGEVEEALGHDAKALAAYEAILGQGGDPAWMDSAAKRMELIKARQVPGTAPAPAAAPPKKKPAQKPAKKPLKDTGGKK